MVSSSNFHQFINLDRLEGFYTIFFDIHSLIADYVLGMTYALRIYQSAG